MLKGRNIMRRKGKGIFIFFVLLLLIGTAAPLMRTKAAGGKLVITEIDYEKETMTVTSANGDQYLYYSDAKMKNWECAYGSFENGAFVLDISWVSKTKDYVLTLKGDKSDEAVSVTLPKQDKAFRASYNYITESFCFEGAEGCTVFWRKADSTTWQAVDQTAQQVFRRLYARGAYLYLRTGQVKGGTKNGAVEAGSRPSKEVKISLTKQASAPTTVTVKSAEQISVNDKMEYTTDGTAAWKPCSGKVLEISEAAPAVFYNGSTPGRDVEVSVRVAATEKRLPSAATVLTIRAQEAAPTGIETEFTNVSTLQITIPEKKDAEGNVTEKKPSSSNPYEYTIVAEGAALSENAVWTAITTEKTKLTAQKAPQGSVVYIRKRGHMEDGKAYQPASLAFTYTVGEYPGSSTVALAGAACAAASLDDKGRVSLVKAAGEKADGLTFKITTPDIFDTDVSAITCGGKALTYTTVKEGHDILVTITDTDKYESAVTIRDTAQAVKITLKNGEVLEKEVTLTILHGASVEKEKNFTVTHGVAPESDYEFTVVPGQLLAKDTDGKYLTTQIASITLLKKEILYTVTENADGTLKVVLTPASFDALFEDGAVEADKAYPLNITMSNGQTVTSGVTVKLSEEAAVSSASHFLVKMEGSDLEEDIVIQFTSKKANVYVVSATWNGVDIMGNCTGGEKSITVTLSCQRMNALTLAEGETILTAPVVFTLNDGAVVSLGYQITLRK